MNQILLAVKPFFLWFGLASVLIACISIAVNTLFYAVQDSVSINMLFLGIGAFLALNPFLVQKKGLMWLIFFLPLAAGMHHQINTLFNLHLSAVPNPGLDLVAGFFISYLSKRLVTNAASLKNFFLPWPLSLLLFYISLSTVLAIIRNIRQTATETSFYGIIFNLTHFRPIGWHDDYMPISDWVAYSCAGAIIILVIHIFSGRHDKNQAIFRPLLAGLVAEFLVGVLQSITGIGLSESMLNFRRDYLGFAAIGFQPDIHAYAGHMLLGAVGVWGYFRACHNRLERTLTIGVIILSWYGLLISKSRASLIIALVATLVICLIYMWKKERKWFYRICIFSAFTISTVTLFLVVNAELMIQSLKNQSSANWLSVIGGASGSRFEIWSGAFNMIKAFPLVGVGQGNFYRLSADIAFSKSHFLALNGGENAHNYFLQSLAELGIVGISFFMLVFIWPILITENRKALLPALLGILALFLGNIYAHSFLVRENLLLCSILIGLTYALICNARVIGVGFWFERLRLIIFIACIFLAGACLHEVYNSFFTKIFDIGVNCFKSRILTEDAWTSGIYEIEIPQGGKGVNVLALRPQTGFYPKDIKLRFDLVNNGGPEVKANSIGTIREGQKGSLWFMFDKPMGKIPQDGIVVMRTQNCFTPRNVGLSVDGRILGVQVNNIKILY